VQQLEWTLQQKTVRAHQDAIVNDTYFREGEYVTTSNPVVSLLTRENIYFVFFIPEPVISRIHLGDRISVELSGINQAFQGTLNYISPQVEYTPPVIYSRDENNKYVFRTRAVPNLNEAFFFHPGQPIFVTITLK
jgi:HlyD family secretion protein